MNETRIDTIARTLGRELARRQALGGLLAVIGGGALPAAASAACKKVGKPCDKNKDCCAGAECKGDECKCKSGRDECSGKCYKLDSDEKHCGECDNACAGGETCCDGTCADLSGDAGNCGACGAACGGDEVCLGGVCGPPPFVCPADSATCSLEGPVYQCGGSGTNCYCSPTTEGTILCGSLSLEGALCGQCQSSADCVALGFGADAFCAKTTADCCGPDADNVCRLPCPA